MQCSRPRRSVLVVDGCGGEQLVQQGAEAAVNAMSEAPVLLHVVVVVDFLMAVSGAEVGTVVGGRRQDGEEGAGGGLRRQVSSYNI